MDSFQKELNKYLHSANRVTNASRLNNLLEWYGPKKDSPPESGRSLFVTNFEKETGLKVPNSRKPKALIEQAFVKNVNEFHRKEKWDEYYLANVLIFLKQMDLIYTSHTRKISLKHAQFPEIFYLNSFNLSQNLFLDSVFLLETWATFKAEVPNTFGVGKNQRENVMHLFQSAKQIIYSHVSPFSFADNHADTSINQIRMAIELRLRQGFGILALIEKSTNNAVPLKLSRIFTAIKENSSLITFSLPLENIERLYGWSNIYMHSGIKPWSWGPIEALDYLAPFLIGGNYSNGVSVNAGIQTTKIGIKKVQESVERQIDKSKYDLIVLEPERCDAIIA